MPLEIETWRPIPGHPSHEVSSLGRVRSIDRVVPDSRHWMHRVRGKVLVTPLNRYGYPCVFLFHGGTYTFHSVHRLVMQAFEPRPDWRTLQVNHKNGVKSDPRRANLEWCTASENRTHAYRVLNNPRPMAGKFGALHHGAVPVIGRCIGTGEECVFPAIAAAGRAGFKQRAISACLVGEQKSHRGWMWRYAKHGESSEWTYTTADTSGALNPSAKAVERIAPDGTAKRYAAASEALREGFTAVGISHCITGRQASHRGYTWRLAQ